MTEFWRGILRSFVNALSGAILLILFMPETANFFDWFAAALALHFFVRTTVGGVK
ncbi:hypothetical protein UFOVP670_7 [uncultured Caudovirales phage]|uniref:Uncharacterized protein n=1 Tax=uncultured Caudovirales phage TaxID=2100421 RepID=A0A6J5N8D4_9CAUD|nr:hypothetical protein UFOVP670_7 [uncultured Caudovirales phage]